MRFLKRISFFIYSCMLLASGFYCHMKYEEMFYPGRASAGYETNPAAAKEAVAVEANAFRITCDTELITEYCDLRTGKTEELTENIPEKYIGLDREQFVHIIADTMAAPLLQERSAGLQSMEVLSFSPEKIVIRKCYQAPRKSDSFYLCLTDNVVVVYEEDRSTLYMQTGIDARVLPDQLRSEILRGMVIDSGADLDKFLESYAGS